MLVLQRAVNESIMLGDDIEITVLGYRNGEVRLGINAPKTFPIHRKEIYDKIKEEGVPVKAFGLQQDLPDAIQEKLKYRPR